MNNRFESLALSGVRSLRPYEPGKPISELEREYGVKNIIKLASNENPLGPSPVALEKCRDSLRELQLYPDGNGFALKQALATMHDVELSCITIGNGSNEILELVARTFLAPGLNAVFSQHAFAVYPIVTQAVGAESRITPANKPDHEMPYGHDLAAMREQVNEDTRVVFIANPNNPTGTWLRSDELESFLSNLPRHVIVVLDEAYVEYVLETEYPDSIPWLKKYPNLLITRTFSKVYGLAGLRIGYSLCHPELADLLNRVRQPFNTNTLAQVAAVAALSDREHLQKSITTNQQGMLMLMEAFAQMKIDTIPSVANFISFKTGKPGAEVYEQLLRAGIIIRPISNYGLPDFLRVTIGSTSENQRFLDALQRILT